MGKDSQLSEKTVKVFPLERFAVYSITINILLLKYDGYNVA